MNAIDQARKYLATVQPAVSGANGHNDTYHVAAALVEGFNLPMADARILLQEYSARCQPPWSERELDHKLADAERKKDPSKVGKMLRGVKWKMGGAKAAPMPKAAPKLNPAPQQAPPGRYPLPDSLELPEPIPDGARQLLQACFLPGECIGIALARTGSDGREVPRDSGLAITREDWIAKLDANEGNPNRFQSTSERNGTFIRINPVTAGGSKDGDVTAYRHALLEFDAIDRVEQFGVIQASQVPAAAVIASGGKSIHAWVKVEAQNRDEYDERVRLIYQHFSEYQPDEKNKNPSRFSRLPGCERGNSRQELLALNIGCESFEEWQTLPKVSGIPAPVTPPQLKEFKIAADNLNLLGNRFLCRAMACLLIAASGLGKSTLGLQMAMRWGIGEPAFGITPAAPLKSLFIQAENDDGDLAEMYQGIFSGMGILPGSEEDQRLDRNIVFQRDNSHTGQAFLDNVTKWLVKHRPDILWLDPILAFVGADLSRMEVIGQFFRNWLNPILDKSQTACICIHHTGKPIADRNARKDWVQSDYAHMGLGSSDLANWARAVMVLIDRGQGLFELKLAKRGKKAHVLDKHGVLTTSLWLRHSSDPTIMFWEPGEAPELAKETRGKPSKVAEIMGMNKHEFMSSCLADGERKGAMAKRMSEWLARSHCDASVKTCERVVEEMVATKQIKKSDGLYFKGENA